MRADPQIDFIGVDTTGRIDAEVERMTQCDRRGPFDFAHALHQAGIVDLAFGHLPGHLVNMRINACLFWQTGALLHQRLAGLRFGIQRCPAVTGGAAGKIDCAERVGQFVAESDAGEGLAIAAQFMHTHRRCDFLQTFFKRTQQFNQTCRAIFRAGRPPNCGFDQQIRIDGIGAESDGKDQVMQVAIACRARYQPTLAPEIQAIVVELQPQRPIYDSQRQMGIEPAVAMAKGQRIVEDDHLRPVYHRAQCLRAQPIDRCLDIFSRRNGGIQSDGGRAKDGQHIFKQACPGFIGGQRQIAKGQQRVAGKVTTRQHWQPQRDRRHGVVGFVPMQHRTRADNRFGAEVFSFAFAVNGRIGDDSNRFLEELRQVARAIAGQN